MAEDLKELHDFIPKISKEMDNIQLKQDTMFVVLGNTGSGKSTFISFLNGAEFDSKKSKVNVNITHKDPSGHPEIGNSTKSCTFIPKSYGKFVDSAGFEDSFGPVREILNNYATAKLFKQGRKVKIILLIQFQDLKSQRGKIMIDTANRLAKLFPIDYENLLNSLSIVCSKIGSDYDLQDVMEQMKDIIEENKNISREAKKMIQKVLENENVCLFPLPKNLNEGLRQEISRKLESLASCVLTKNAEISLSEEAVLKLQSLKKNLFQNQMHQSQKVISFLKIKYEKQQTTIKQVQDVIKDLQRVQSFLDPKKFIQFLQKIQIDEKVQNQIENIEKNLSFCESFETNPEKPESHIQEITNCLNLIKSEKEMRKLQIKKNEEIENERKKKQAAQQLAQKKEKERKAAQQLAQKKEKERKDAQQLAQKKEKERKDAQQLAEEKERQRKAAQKQAQEKERQRKAAQQQAQEKERQRKAAQKQAQEKERQRKVAQNQRDDYVRKKKEEEEEKKKIYWYDIATFGITKAIRS